MNFYDTIYMYLDVNIYKNDKIILYQNIMHIIFIEFAQNMNFNDINTDGIRRLRLKFRNYSEVGLGGGFTDRPERRK
jgi:hypothetical protein